MPILGKNLGSGFGSKKQAVFGQSSRFLSSMQRIGRKKRRRMVRQLTFFGRNASG
jgi:hypothetical protein